MRVVAGAATDVGRVRERNEDAFVARNPLFAVADGMGGHQGGEVASRVALEVLAAGAGEALGAEPSPEGLAEVVGRANAAVLAQAAGDQSLSGMGTTITAAVLTDGRMHLVHVGDSRAYLLRDGRLTRLTEDHTLVQRLVNEGKLTPQEAEIHPHRSVLTRALGVEADVEIDRMSEDVRTGDRILLCSDGLTSMVPEEEITRLLAGHDDPQAAAEALVTAANDAGGVDNITAVVLFVLEGEEAAGGGPRAYVQPASSPVRPAAPPGPRRRGRALAALAAIVIALVAVGVGARAFVYRQWFVGVHEGRVALFQGMPVQVLGVRLNRLVEVTDLSAEEAQRLRPWRDLDEGITAQSEAGARGIIATIERDLQLAQGQETQRPGPSPEDQGGSG